MLPVLTELRHALDMQSALESLVEEGNYCKVGSYIWLVYDLQFLIFFFLFIIIILLVIYCSHLVNGHFCKGVPSSIGVFAALR
jgi:hypothetical protein